MTEEESRSSLASLGGKVKWEWKHIILIMDLYCAHLNGIWLFEKQNISESLNYHLILSPLTLGQILLKPVFNVF